MNSQDWVVCVDYDQRQKQRIWTGKAKQLENWMRQGQGQRKRRGHKMGRGGSLGLEQIREWWQGVRQVHGQGIRQGNGQEQVQGDGIKQILVRVQQGLGKVQRRYLNLTKQDSQFNFQRGSTELTWHIMSSSTHRKVAFPTSPSPTTPPPSQPITIQTTSSKER